MLQQLLEMIVNKSLKFPNHIWNKLLILWLSRKNNIEIGPKLILNGRPLIDIQKEGNLYIGSEVTLNSRNKGYHINMHSPVKLFADRPGAEIRIGDKTRIHGTCVHAYQSVKIGSNCLIVANCQIFDGNGHNLSFQNVDNRIIIFMSLCFCTIDYRLWIGANSIILPGVTIGKGTVISANSVVTRDIPSMVVAGGNPAIIIKKYTTIDYKNL